MSISTFMDNPLRKGGTWIQLFTVQTVFCTEASWSCFLTSRLTEQEFGFLRRTLEEDQTNFGRTETYGFFWGGGTGPGSYTRPGSVPLISDIWKWICSVVVCEKKSTSLLRKKIWSSENMKPNFVMEKRQETGQETGQHVILSIWKIGGLAKDKDIEKQIYPHISGVYLYSCRIHHKTSGSTKRNLI